MKKTITALCLALTLFMAGRVHAEYLRRNENESDDTHAYGIDIEDISDITDEALKLYEHNGKVKAGIANVRASTRKHLESSKLMDIAPYAMFGAKTALSENWQLIKDAYDNKAEWSQALSRTGLDFAGYTVTPVMIDGILASSGKRMTLMTSMKNAGTGYTLGFFCWNAGREFCSWQSGNISRDEFMSRIRHNAAREIEMIPVNVMAYLVAGTGHTFFVPAVIIGGKFAVQRVHEWYESKRWKKCIYTDDLRDILGDDLMNAFTIAEPEMRYNIAEPERRFNIAEP